jgi:inorganic pyrophosphatase
VPKKSTTLDRLPPRDDEGLYHVVIETPKGSPHKLTYENDLGTFKLSAVLPEGSTFPFDFGFIPSTLGDDGDPLDVLLLMDHPLMPGTIVPARLIGVITGEQSEDGEEPEQNDRLIGVSPESPLYKKTKTLSELPEELVTQLEKFFVNYNEQRGKKFTPKGSHGWKTAETLFRKGQKKFAQKRRG